ncbi:MAG: hypothetical protein Q7T20_10945 [Saprospiraceae bacterium]|nr:hypothetical protein [Saprospiraceae bacterium]
MIKLLLAYDGADSRLGTYFSSCFSDLETHASTCGSFEVCAINEHHDETHLEENIASFQGTPFLFAAYTHGRQDAIVHKGTALVHTTNAYFFGGSLVYTCACSAGQELAGILRAQGCRAFIGFSADTILLSTEAHDDIFRDCENYGLKIFMSGEKTIKESYQAMYENYTKRFDEFCEIGFAECPFDLAALLDVRNALFMDAEGNEHLTLADFASS